MAVAAAIFVSSTVYVTWTQSTDVADVYKNPTSQFFSLFIGEQQTIMAVSCGAQIWRRKY